MVGDGIMMMTLLIPIGINIEFEAWYISLILKGLFSHNCRLFVPGPLQTDRHGHHAFSDRIKFNKYVSRYLIFIKNARNKIEEIIQV